jgi:SWI/SNF-related matrix-associated actin-dependent regulator of chromatin subfamily A3
MSNKRQPLSCRHILSKEDLFLAPEVKHYDEDGSDNITAEAVDSFTERRPFI